MMLDLIDQFRNAMVKAGITPPTEIYVDGKKHRFSTNGNPKDTAGEYRIYPDGGIPAGYFIDFRIGECHRWSLNMGRPYTSTENIELKKAIEKRAQQEQAEQNAAMHKAQEIWNAAPEANPTHPYLLGKGITPIGLRTYKNNLLIPVTLNKKVYSLQFITPDGQKFFMSNGRVHGCYFIIGEPTPTICICEGVATGFSIHQATGHAVVVAFNCGNLLAVSRHIRDKNPQSLILICSDDDTAGLKFAKQAVELSNGKLIIPLFDKNRPEKATDFNDMATLYGLDQVKDLINSACVIPDVIDIKENWPEIIPLGSRRLPSLNLDFLSGWLCDYARALSKATSTPPELAAGLTLAVCSTATSRCFKILVKPGYYEPSNLWIIVALEPGNRKSAVQSAATKPLDIWEHKQAKCLEPEIKRLSSERKTMEARAKEKRNQAVRAKESTKAKDLSKEAADLEAALPNIPTFPRLWLSDTTPEELAVQLKNNNECMAWLSSEGGMFDLLAGRYAKGVPNLDLILKSHSGDSEKITRKSCEPIILNNPLVSIGLSPQPSVLSGLASNKAFRGRGLLGRCLFLIPLSPLGYRTSDNEAIPDNVSNEYSEAIQAMLNWKSAINKETGEKEPHIVKFSNEATSKYDVFFNLIELEMAPGGKLEHFKDWGGKAPGAAVRIAGVLHGAMYAYGQPWDIKISGETMNNAIAIMMVSMEHSLAAFNIMGMDPIIDSAQRILHWIESRRLTSFTISDAFCALRGRFERVKQVEEALEVLIERGYIKIDEPLIKTKPGRRASPTVRVSPKLQDQWQ